LTFLDLIVKQRRGTFPMTVCGCFSKCPNGHILTNLIVEKSDHHQTFSFSSHHVNTCPQKVESIKAALVLGWLWECGIGTSLCDLFSCPLGNVGPRIL